MLKAGGAAIGLPLLNAMIPAATALAQTAAAPKPRMGFFYLPHGAIMNNTSHGAEMNRWTPDMKGRDFDLKPILEPFKPLQKYMTVVSGLGNKPGESSAVHAIVPATWLSAVHPRQSHAPFGGVTIDQVAARHIGQDTPLPSLEVATEEEGGGAACDGTYGCSYGKTISFRTPTTPLPMEFDPRKAFEKIFGRGNNADQRKAVANDYLSLLDMVNGEANSLKKTLGADDRVLVSDYLDSVREIERRVSLLGQRDLSKVDLPEVPVALPEFRPTPATDVRPDRRGIPGRHDTDRVVHDGGRGQQPVIRARWHPRRIPSAVASRRKQGGDGKARHRPEVPHPGVLRVHAEAREDPRRRRLGARQFDLLVRRQHEQQQRAQPVPVADAVFGHGVTRSRATSTCVYPDHTPLANLLFTLLLRAGVPVDKVGDSLGELTEV
jgi:hypothetical protein